MNRNDDFDIMQSLENVLNQIIGFLPELLGAILLVLIGWFLAALAKRVTKKFLGRVRFDKNVHTSPGGNYISRIVEHPTSFVAKFVWWLVFLAFLSFAISALGVPVLNEIVLGIYSYIPNIIAAIIIFLVASAISAGAAAFAQKVMGSSPLGKILAAAIPAITMSIAVFMILNQLLIAPTIVNITYAALMGSLALGLALAFGLGGQGVASQILSQAYENTKQHSGQLKGDLKHAADKTKAQAQRAKSNMK